MSKAVDVPCLIAEVKKRPAIWDGRPKARQFLPKLWLEVAENVGTDVNQCKRKWKNLRDAYHAELRRYLRRLQSYKLSGDNEPNITKYKSKWVYFPNLAFLSESKQLNNDYSIDSEMKNSDSNDHHHLDDTRNSCSTPEQNVHSVTHVKLEPSLEIDHNFDEAENYDTDDNDLPFEEFENITMPQAATRLSETFSIRNVSENNSTTKQFSDIPSTATTPKCKCSHSVDEQVHFLQDLGREEQRLMNSTRQDITRCNKLDHIGDYDYNFLVSFLPQMKKMSELQNLQFRAKMSELVLSILTDVTTQHTPKRHDDQATLSSTS